MPVTFAPLKETPVVLHQGIYKKTASVAQAVFMITGMTIGAGVLGLPYVISKVGLPIGLAYIIVFGLIILSLNLMVGEIAVRTNERLQLAGFAGKYIGSWAKHFLSALLIFGIYGVHLAYIIGAGAALSAMFRGDSLWWGMLFWSIGSSLIWLGFGAVKRVEMILSILVIALIAGLSFYLLPHGNAVNFWQFNAADLFLPYGFVLFSLSASSAVVEAHVLLPGSERRFKRAVIIGTLIPILVYILFVTAVIGAQGANISEVVTIGLGAEFGRGVSFVGNLFAVLAMGTAFITSGIVLKQTFVWDLKLRPAPAAALVISVPLMMFLLGLRSFILVLDTVGGIIVSLIALFMVIICWRAKQMGDLNASRYSLRHFWLMAAPVAAVFTFAAVYYILKMFI